MSLNGRRRLNVFFLLLGVLGLVLYWNPSLLSTQFPSHHKLSYEDSKDCKDLSRPRSDAKNNIIPCECTFVSESDKILLGTTSTSQHNVETFEIHRLLKSKHSSRGKKLSGIALRPCECSKPSPIHSLSEMQIFGDAESPHILALTLVKNHESWGRGRSIIHHLLMLISYYDDDSHKHTPPITIGLMVSDKSEYTEIIRQLSHIYLSDTKPPGSPVDCVVKNWILSKLNIQKIFVVYQPKEDQFAHNDRWIRHLISVQKQRRRNIAKLRNQLIAYSFRNLGKSPAYELVERVERVFGGKVLYDVLSSPLPSHFLWTDADILHIPGWDDIEYMLKKKDADIVTIRCTRNDFGPDYDMNSWVGPRTKPTESQLEQMRLGNDTYTPYPTTSTKFLLHGITPDSSLTNKSPQQIREIRRKNWMKLDSVGGTFLLVKSQVFIDGAIFPPYNVVGTEWELTEGWDGIETEGLCYVAKTLGYQCWGLPDLTSEHDNS